MSGEAPPRASRAEIVVAVLAIAVSAVFLWVGRSLPASPFEPIGSATVPAIVAGLAIAFALWCGVVALRDVWFGPASVKEAELGWRVAGLFVWTVVYAAVLAWGRVRYGVATAVFLPVAVVILAERPWPLIGWALGGGLAAGIGLDLLFRHVFSVDLP